MGVDKGVRLRHRTGEGKIHKIKKNKYMRGSRVKGEKTEDKGSGKRIMIHYVK